MYEVIMHTQDIEQEGVGDMAIRVVMSEQLLEDINYMDDPELRGKNLFDRTRWVAGVTAPGKGLGGRWPWLPPVQTWSSAVSLWLPHQRHKPAACLPAFPSLSSITKGYE